MQISTEDLRQIIKEELNAVLDEKKGKKTKSAKKKKRKKKKKAKAKKKDACYSKVKSRYKVWPSAYASGALVKCRKVGAANWGNSKKEGLEEEFQKHDMYDPESGKKYNADVEQDHTDMAKKGYTHVDPKKIEKILRDEGGAAGMDPFLKEFGKEQEKDILKTLEDMPSVKKHQNGDYILDDNKDVNLSEKKQASSEKDLGDWFKRKGEKGSKGGWVDCKAPDGDGGYKECAQGGRKKKPYCRPTPSACKTEPQTESKKRIKKGNKK